MTKLLKPLASLKLTVILLAMSMFLVYAGTWAQVAWSIWDVQNQYFYSTIVWIPLKSLFTRLDSAAVHNSHPFKFPFPGGYILGLALLINLLSAHTVRFKMSWKRSGIILIHLGLIMLLVGEGVSSRLKVENKMMIGQGESRNYVFDDKEGELAIIDPSPADHDNVTVVSAKRLAQGGVVQAPGLPFSVRVDGYFENTKLIDRSNNGDGGPRATAGKALVSSVEGRGAAKASGTGDNAMETDFPSAYVTPLVDGKPVAGTFFLTSNDVFALESGETVNGPQSFSVNGKTYLLDVRFKRTYKPYSIELKKFTVDYYPGTDQPRSYAADVRYVNASKHEDRMVHIWMNHPLRLLESIRSGETIYQAGYRGERTTILQVVGNPVLWIPYVACAVGGLGLVLHFGIMLVGFVRRRFAAKPATSTTAAPAKGKARPAGPVQPVFSWRDLAIPCIVGILAVVYAAVQAFPEHSVKGFDYNAVAQFPVQEAGRVQPLDQVARVTLRSIRGRDTIQPTDVGRQKGDAAMSAAEWLFDVMFRAQKAAEYKVFRVDFPELADRLSGGKTDQTAPEKYFSLNDFFRHFDELAPQIADASGLSEKEQTGYQQKLLQLANKVRIYLRFNNAEDIQSYRAIPVGNVTLRKAMGLPPGREMFTLAELRDSGHVRDLFDLAGVGPDGRLLGDADPQGGPQALAARRTYKAILVLTRLPGRPLLLAPRGSAEESWLSLPEAEDIAGKSKDPNDPSLAQVRPALLTYDFLHRTADADEPDKFNDVAGAYLTGLSKKLPQETSKARFETWFNAFDPFYHAKILYVSAFILVCCSWLFWGKTIARTAAVIIGVSLLVHTIGLIARIYISGRPPVTNLTSASIFIAWGGILLALGLEYFFRNTIGLLTAAALGFGSLMLADALSMQEGDTLKVLQPVLDTNFWLATHVVCVTLGYATTVLAGLLGAVYIIRGVFTTTLTKESSKELARMIYGVVCFAMVFSFIGTVLGGIWADQSWGRFWGWDSKENGAVLVVLANAILLHARWGGIVRDRGIAVLSIFGIMITQWSFLGTNQLGVGLHSYGFTEGLWGKLMAGWAVEFAVLLIGLTPLPAWASFRLRGQSA